MSSCRRSPGVSIASKTVADHEKTVWKSVLSLLFCSKIVSFTFPKHGVSIQSPPGQVYGPFSSGFRRGWGCAVRLSAAADWDCCSVNKTVRGCNAAVCGREDFDGDRCSWLLSFYEQLCHVPSTAFSAQRLHFCSGKAGPIFSFLI